MNVHNRINYTEHLSLLLVLSYFFFHNILMVISGVVLAIYMINISFINNHIFKNMNNVKREDDKEVKIDPDIELNLKRADSSNEGDLISLVDVIEESGFIPSLEKDDFSNAA